MPGHQACAPPALLKGGSSSLDEPDGELQEWWSQLSRATRKKLVQVDRRKLFQRIHQSYCSRCHGLFTMRFDELRSSDALECEACAQFYSGLMVTPEGALSLEDRLIDSQPFTTFVESKARERERELQFMTGDICGNGFRRAPGVTSCSLHTARVPVEALAEYWSNLPQEHKDTLFGLREEDFVAELDAHMRYHLKICRDCRGNVMKAYKELKSGARDAKQGSSQRELLQVCDGHQLIVADGLVSLEGPATAVFFERAEEVEECNAIDGDCSDGFDAPDRVRHAETPELAREALVDSVVLIFKSQVEVAFREQTAGHNALLLFVHMTLQMMEEQIWCSFKELRAKQAEAELLQALESEQRAQATKRAAKKKRRGRAAEGGAVETGEQADAAAAAAELLAMGGAQDSSSAREEEAGRLRSPCRECAALQGVDASPSRQSLRCSLPCCMPVKQVKARQAGSTGDSPPAPSTPTSLAGDSRSPRGRPAARERPPGQTVEHDGKAKVDGAWEVQQRRRPAAARASSVSSGTASSPAEASIGTNTGAQQQKPAATMPPAAGAAGATAAPSGGTAPAVKPAWGAAPAVAAAGLTVAAPVAVAFVAATGLGAIGSPSRPHKPAGAAAEAGTAGSSRGAGLVAAGMIVQPPPPPPRRPSTEAPRPAPQQAGAWLGSKLGAWAAAPGPTAAAAAAAPASARAWTQPPPPPRRPEQAQHAASAEEVVARTDAFSLFSHAPAKKGNSAARDAAPQPASGYQLFAQSGLALQPFVLPLAL